MGKKIINILLILVLAVTVLPVKQVGNAIFNNQFTEELNDHAGEGADKKLAPCKWNFVVDHDLLFANRDCMLPTASSYFSFSQSLPVNPSGEIHSPPPNLLQ